MSLTDAAKQRPGSSVACWAQSLPPDIRSQLDDVEKMQEAEEPINKTAVWRDLKAQGVSIEKGAVLRHFRYECTCR